MNKPSVRFKGYTDAWKQRKVSDITTSYSGGTPQAGNSEYYNGDIPFIRSGEIYQDYTELFITKKAMDNSSAKMISKGDILYALYGATSGEVSRARLEGAINQAILAIVPNKGYNADFLVEWFRKEKANIIDKYLQGGQGNLSAQIIKNLEVNIPSSEEQDKIGEFFRDINDIITLHQRKCEETKLLKKYMLQKMFPQNGADVPEIRFAGFTDAWEQRKLDEWGTFYYGKSCPKWSVKEDATIPCIRYGELYTKFGTKIDSVYSYTSIPPENLIFSKGTEVLIPRVGEEPMDYNHCAWLSMPNVAIGEMISVFNTENNPLFTATMFNATLQNEFAMRVEGGSVTNLYYEKLKNIEVSFPILREQEKIAEYFESIDNLITLHKRKLDMLKELKRSFLEKMFV